MRKIVWLLFLIALGALLSACGGGTSESETYAVSGTVEDDQGDPIEGVTIGFGGASDEVTTDANGKWSVSDLKGDVTVTPTHTNYGFSPKDRTVNDGANDVDFVGHASFGLAGTVNDSDDDALEGVEIELSFDGQVLSTTTDAVGDWNVDGVFGDVTVTPVLPGYAFTPESAEHSTEASNVDFVGEMQPCTSGDPADLDDPCTITHLEQLQNIQDNLVGHFALIANINASETATWNGGEGFEPIGNEDDPFTGTLDGRDHRIQSLTIHRPTEKHVGLFGVLGVEIPPGAESPDELVFGTVENLELSSVNVRGETQVGALAGQSQGLIRNVTVTGEVEATNGIVGGLVGRIYENYAETAVYDAHAEVDVVGGTSSVGGLVGEHSSAGAIDSSSSAGTVSGKGSTGGLIGQTNSANVYNSHSTADVQGNGLGVGGLVGQNSYNTLTHSWSSGTVTNAKDYTGGLLGENNSGKVHYAYSTSDVTGENTTGGLVGRNYNSNADIRNAYALGDVQGANKVGGLIGSTFKAIERTFSAGKVFGDNDVGGLVGAIDFDGDVSESYWDEDTSEQTQSAGGGEGKSTSDMYKENTYTAWDFDDIWTIDAGNDYPDLIENPR